MMKKSIQMIALALFMELLCLFSSSPSPVHAVADDNWYLKAKYGLYLTYQYNDADWVTQTGFGYTCYPDGRLTRSIDELADAFDATKFAQDCADMGVQYVTFTAYHGHMYVLYPSAVVESKLPGHTAGRDVIRSLIDALHAKGIKLQLYIHASIGDSFTDAQKAATSYNDATGHYKMWNDFINSFFDELSARYGTEIDSYYIDMISSPDYLIRVDAQRLRNTLLAHNPSVPIVGNGNAETAADYGSREDGDYYLPDIRSRITYPTQTVLCQSNLWWSSIPATGGNAAKYTPEHLLQYLVMTAGANAAGGGLALGATPYVTGGWEPGVKESLVALNRLLTPIKESVLNTYPSTSYITPGGVNRDSLTSGITAMRSADSRYEYIHVLVPPIAEYVAHDTMGTGSSMFDYGGRGWQNGTDGHHYSNIPNDSATMDFSGTQIMLSGYKDTMHGIMAVSVDGGPETDVDMYSALRTASMTVYSSPLLRPGNHRIRIRITGSKNSRSTNYYASVAGASLIDSSTLSLPPPVDGKAFSSAVMLRSGKAAALVQDRNGVRITVPDAWDPLDTVIRLKVGAVKSWPAVTMTIPHAKMSIASVSGYSKGNEASKAIDGDSATFWGTDNSPSAHQYPQTSWTGSPPSGWLAGVRQYVVMDLGDTYLDVNNVRYLPRQDGFTGDYRSTDLYIYNLYSSLDGIHFTAIKTGQWNSTASKKSTFFAPAKARYIKIEAAPSWNYQFGDTCYAAAEIHIGTLTGSTGTSSGSDPSSPGASETGSGDGPVTSADNPSDSSSGSIPGSDSGNRIPVNPDSADSGIIGPGTESSRSDSSAAEDTVYAGRLVVYLLIAAAVAAGLAVVVWKKTRQ
ncbi:MAG: alpha-L-fucosidase [Saccharofermentanales bacterium]